MTLPRPVALLPRPVALLPRPVIAVSRPVVLLPCLVALVVGIAFTTLEPLIPPEASTLFELEVRLLQTLTESKRWAKSLRRPGRHSTTKKDITGFICRDVGVVFMRWS
jgi:hypothetical protein